LAATSAFSFYTLLFRPEGKHLIADSLYLFYGYLVGNGVGQSCNVEALVSKYANCTRYGHQQQQQLEAALTRRAAGRTTSDALTNLAGRVLIYLVWWWPRVLCTLPHFPCGQVRLIAVGATHTDEAQ